MNQGERIVFFDGVCNLCNGLVRFIIRMDRKKRIMFSALQSEAARERLKAAGIDADKVTSVAYLTEGKFYYKSAAILHIFKDTGGILKGLYLFVILPRFLRDAVYNFIAARRYRIFGRKDSCMIPDDNLADRFL